MDARTAFSNIRDALSKLKIEGQEFVSIDALVDYLLKLESAAPDSIEFQRLQHDSSLAHYRAEHESNLEMFKSVIEAGRTALVSCILVNGGAAVAMLAYLGNFLAENPNAKPAQELVTGLAMFSTAVLCGALATAVRYTSQASFSAGWYKTGHGFKFVAMFLVVTAYVLFGRGIWEAYQAFA